MSWYSMAFLSAIILTPGFLTPAFLNFNFGLRPDVILAWYFLGMAVGCWAGPVGLGSIPAGALAPTVPLIGAALAGLLFGAGSNILLFRAIVVSPNPGLPLSFINLSVVLTFVASVALASAAPKFFAPARFDLMGLVGVALTLAGVVVLGLRK